MYSFTKHDNIRGERLTKAPADKDFMHFLLRSGNSLNLIRNAVVIWLHMSISGGETFFMLIVF